ncbi:DNA repair/transcription protein MET18/MMS19 [Schistosoma japonicum]|nr:DNA repair/transcription protein MET18/MMS19 [Schistosoma japonicum]
MVFVFFLIITFQMESLLDLIRSLESGLTNTKISSQKESMETLITGIKNIPPSNVTCKEIDHLIDFLSDRLSLADPNITNLILDGFLWLTKSKWSIDGCSMINPEQAKQIVQHGVFGHLTIQNLTKSGRLKVFQLLHYFLTGSQLSVIDFKEELFETISVYFPIDFSPPPGGGIAGITRDLLVSGLHQCLFAMRNITGHSLMLLICEKLESQWPNGQLDALSLLSDCLHGRVQCINDKDSYVASDKNPIDIRHISPFLGVIVPLLIKIGDKIEKRRDKTDLNTLALSCISGLVHAYSVQTNEKFQLEDFTLILLRSIGLLSNESNQRQPPSALMISTNITVDYVLESFKWAQNNILLSSVLFMYTIPRLCAPLSSDSVINSCDEVIITEKLKINIDELINWQSCICVLDKIFHSITEENLINALHYDQQLLKILNIIIINANFIINMIQECIPNSCNPTKPSTLTFNEKSIHFLICLCRLFYSLIKYTSSGNDSSPSSSSYVDSIINAICSTIQWLDKTLTNNNDNLFDYEVLRSIKDELLSFIPTIYNSCDLFVCKLDQFLFDYLTNCQLEQTVLNNPNCFTMDILKYCSCKNPSLLQKATEFILEKCNSIMLSLDSESTNNILGFQYWGRTLL